MSISDKIIIFSFDLAASVIQTIFRIQRSENLLNGKVNLHKDTVGYQLDKCLREQGYDLIPYFESHDLKHIILGYEMKPLDEIRMQAYLLGNGNYSAITLLIFIFGLLFKLSYFPTFVNDYKRGQFSKSIRHLRLSDCIDENINSIQNEYTNSMKKDIAKISAEFLLDPKALGLLTSLIGGLGMIYCLPFLYSSNLVDVVGAGLPFIAGSILVVGGLYVYSNNIERNKNAANTAPPSTG